LREGEWRGEVVNTAGDGTQSIVEVHSWVVRDPEGNAKYLCGISSDITERKRAEETLRESEQRFRAAANCSSDLIYEDNNETGQVKWYGDIDGLLGYKQGEFRATFQGWKNSLHPEDRDRVIKEIEKCTHTGEAYCVEYRIKHKNGTYRYWVDRGTVFQEEGKPRKTVGACEDITEHKRIEQALRESEVKHRTLLENLPQKIFYKDVDSVYISCNENFARDLGIKSEEFAGRTDYEFFPEKLAEKYRNDDKRIIESGKTEEIEEKYVRDGKEFIVKTLKTPVRDEEGNIAGILGVFWDITERRRIEVELEQYREKMVRAEQLAGLGAVGANLSHQLNQPLTVIQLMLENSKTRLEKTSCPEIVKENIKEGLEAVAMADRIVKCYRDLARFPDHTMFKKIDLQKIADQLALVLSKSALQSQLRLVIEDMRNLPKIIGDPGELEQIFFILIENAIQAADGKKERQLTIRAANQDGKLRLEFTDDCGGIEPENLDKIYDPFFTTKPRGQGTGLGLGIVQQILARHKGTIRVESQVGRGTTFYVTLPWIKLI